MSNVLTLSWRAFKKIFKMRLDSHKRSAFILPELNSASSRAVWPAVSSRFGLLFRTEERAYLLYVRNRPSSLGATNRERLSNFGFAWKLRQGDVDSALEYWEWYKGAEIRSLDDLHFQPRPQSIQAVLSASDDPPSLPVPTFVAQNLPTLKDQTILAYAVFPEGIAAWGLPPICGISNRWISKRESDLSESTTRFLRLCAERDSDVAAVSH